MKILFIDFDGVVSTFEKGWRLDEEKLSLLKEEIESYAILDDDSDMRENQLFNFVQTDGYEGITSREVKLCIKILNNERIQNPIRLNLELTTKWRNNCNGLDKNNISLLLKEYYNKFV